VIIRDFKREDFDEVIEGVEKSFVEEFEITGLDPDVWRKLVGRRFSILGKTVFGVLRFLGREPIKFFVAVVDGKIVGTTIVTKHRNTGHVETVMVHPDFRRRGIATKLIETALNYVRKRKFVRAVLQVSSNNNAAKDLYRKFGFKKFDQSVYLSVNVDSLPGFEKPDGILVRGFQKSDIDDVYAFIKSSRDPNLLQIYDFRKDDLKTSLLDRMARMSTEKKIVAVYDGKIVGYASLGYTTAKEAGRIRSLEVSPELASTGIVEELIRKCVDYVKPSGTKTVLVAVPLAKEGLIKRLEALGFKKGFVMEGMVLE